MLCRYAPEKLELHAGTATCRFRTLAARRDNSLVAQILAHDGAARHHTAPSHVEQDDGMDELNNRLDDANRTFADALSRNATKLTTFEPIALNAG